MFIVVIIFELFLMNVFNLIATLAADRYERMNQRRWTANVTRLRFSM